jgi:capsular exopolysaccharide synthesis family protein
MNPMAQYQGRIIREILFVVFRYKFVISFIILAIMTSVYIGLELRTPIHYASVEMLVTGKMPRDLEYVRSLGSGSLVDTQKQLVLTRPVLERTVRALKLDERPLDYEKKYATKFKKYFIERKFKKIRSRFKEMTPEEIEALRFNHAYNNLVGKVDAFSHKDSSILTIMARDYNPAETIKIANVLSRSFVIFDLEHQVAELQLMYGHKNATIQKLQHHIARLEDSLNGRLLTSTEALGPASVKIINQAQYSRMKITKPGRATALVIAFIMSIVTSALFVFALNNVDSSFKSPYDIERTLNIPYLGSIPRKKPHDNSLITSTENLSRYTYSFQSIAEDIFILMKDRSIKSLLITDTRVSESTSTIIANLGMFLVQKIRQTVLVIDVNIKAPTLSKVLSIENSPGLVDVLEGKILFEDAVREIQDDLFVLTSGGRDLLHTTALLECSKMKKIIEESKDKFGMVLVNYACLKQYCDAIILSSIADGALIVVNDGKSRKQHIIESVNFMKQKEIKILGAILNDRKDILPKILYQYT